MLQVLKNQVSSVIGMAPFLLFINKIKWAILSKFNIAISVVNKPFGLTLEYITKTSSLIVLVLEINLAIYPHVYELEGWS